MELLRGRVTRGWTLRVGLALAVGAVLTNVVPTPSSAGTSRPRRPAPPALPAPVDSVIVKYRDARPGHTPPLAAKRLLGLQSAAAGLGEHLTLRHTMGIGAYVVELSHRLGGRQLTELTRRLQGAEADVEWVEPNRQITAGGSGGASINDTFFGQQWSLADTLDAAGGIGAKTAWGEDWTYSSLEDQPAYGPVDAYGPRLVRFGQYGSPWTYRELAGDFACTRATFDNVDPAPGIRKRCEVATNWVTVAREGQTIQLARGVTKFVRFGYGDRWYYRAITDHGSCDDATFGDPWRFQVKICQVEVRPDNGGIVALYGGGFTLDRPATVEFGKLDRWVYRQIPADVPTTCSAQSFGSDPWPVPAEQICQVVRSMGGNVTVAVLDKGILSHPDLRANIVPGYDFVQRDSDPTDPGRAGCNDPDALPWHGLSVAGVASAVTNNSLGIAGVAPMSKTLMARIADCNGNMTLSDISDALVWASGGDVAGVPKNANPARLIVMTRLGFGNEPCDAPWQDTFSAVAANNALVTVAAGNDNRDLTGVDWAPGTCPGTLVVGGTDDKGARWPGSNYGVGVGISAPASNVLVLSNQGTTTPADYAYVFAAGTSFAAPEAAGVGAMMLSKNPALTATNLRWRLILSSRPYPVPCPSCAFGILDANRALVSAQAITTETEPNDLESTANLIAGPADVSGTFKADDIDFYRMDVPPGQKMLLLSRPGTSVECIFRGETDVSYRSCAPPGTITAWPNTTTTTRRVYLAFEGVAGVSYRFAVTWR